MPSEREHSRWCFLLPYGARNSGRCNGFVKKWTIDYFSYPFAGNVHIPGFPEGVGKIDGTICPVAGCIEQPRIVIPDDADLGLLISVPVTGYVLVTGFPEGVCYVTGTIRPVAGCIQ